MKYELVVFDWDGTLLDSAGAIVHAIQASCRDLGLPVPEDARARHVIGLGLVDALRHAAPDLRPENYQAMVERYRYHYLAGDKSLTLFEGVPEMLQRLKVAGHILAVATGKSRLGLERVELLHEAALTAGGVVLVNGALAGEHIEIADCNQCCSFCRADILARVNRDTGLLDEGTGTITEHTVLDAALLALTNAFNC